MRSSGAATIVAMTYNLWGDHRLGDRAGPLRELLGLRDPDLLATQELRPESRALVDGVLGGHRRVDDEFPGWAGQSNIWWRDETFELVEYDVEDIGIRADHAGLFWVRLTHRQRATPLVVATAHYTWPGHEQEGRDGISPRPDHARRTVAALDRLAGGDPCLFVGDLNDYARPLWILRAGGFDDAFSGLRRTSPVTHPVFPNPLARDDVNDPQFTPSTIDWQFYRGAVRPLVAEVVDFFDGGLPPSDHRPVCVAYRLGDLGADDSESRR